MKPIWRVLTGLATWGCGADQARVDDILALDPDHANGADVYTASCEECHASDGSAINDGSFQLAGKDLRDMTQERIVETILDPPDGMLDFTSLSDQDIADVSAHAESL
jgi:mono/diheme cytochrome c family protein